MNTIDLDPDNGGRQPGAPWDMAAVARFLGLSTRHVVRLADGGKLETIRFGRRRLVPDREVRRVAAEGTH